MRPDGPFAGHEPADPNASAVVPDVRPASEPIDPNARAESTDTPDEPEPATVSLGVANRPDLQPDLQTMPADPRTEYSVVAQPSANSYGSYDTYTDPWVARADEILSDDPFTEPAGESPPAIWGDFRDLVESTVDAAGRGSVLRAGWLALRGEIGEGK